MKNGPALLLLLSFATCSIHAQRSQDEKAFQKGEKALVESDFLRAKPWLKQATIFDPLNANYQFTYGKCLFDSWSQREALPYFLRSLELDPYVNEELYYFLGRTQHLNGNFEEAVNYYQEDLARYEDIRDPKYNEVLLCIDQCRSAITLSEKSTLYSIENIGDNVNTRWPEYASTFADNYQYMLFTSRRPNDPYQSSYGVYLKDDIGEQVYSSELLENYWSKTERFKNNVNVFSHDASVSVSEDGNTMIYYVDRHYGDIFVSRNEEGKWTKRESIGEKINTPKFTEPSIFISDFGQTLFYVSNKPGGIGGSDLYIATKDEKGNWGEGKNLGAVINSTYHEDSPFVTEDGKTLYFASNGPESIGGYDIFKCEKRPDGTWSSPENLGTPINSPGDDIFYYERNDGKGFYLSSDRPGGFGDMDIYFGYVSGLKDDHPLTHVDGHVISKMSRSPIEAEVRLVNSKTKELIESRQTAPKDGSFSIQIPKCGVDYEMEVRVATEGSERPITTGAVNLVAGTVREAISGNPLNANIQLIDPSSGEILKQFSSNSESGQYLTTINSGKKYILKVQSNGFLPFYEEFQVEQSDKFKPHYIDVGLQKTNESNRIVINWQVFDPTESIIKQKQIPELDNLAEALLGFPSLRIKIIGFCDSDGDEKYNLDLSIKRAQEVAAYLFQKGITKERMDVSGLGELNPVYDNNDPNLKKWNRRVEILILN